MVVCRLCGDEDPVVDLFHPQLEKAEQIRFYILLATGIHIKNDDKISKMVCHKCCEIAVKLYKYRANVIDNDKGLQNGSGLPYSPPLTDQKELYRIGIHLLMKGRVPLAAIDKSIFAKCLYETFDPSLFKESLKIPSQQQVSHISIQRLKRIYPNIKLPPNLTYSDIDPEILLDESKVFNWQRKMHRKKLHESSLLRGDIKENEMHSSTLCKLENPNFSPKENSILDQNDLEMVGIKPPLQIINSLESEVSVLSEELANRGVTCSATAQNMKIKCTLKEDNPNKPYLGKRSIINGVIDTNSTLPKKQCILVGEKPLRVASTDTFKIVSKVLNNMKFPFKKNTSTCSLQTPKIPTKIGKNTDTCKECQGTCKCKNTFSTGAHLSDASKAAVVVVQQEIENKNNTSIQGFSSGSGVICISDNEDEPARITGLGFQKYNLKQDEVIELLFRKHSNLAESHGEAQTSIPNQNNIRYLTPQLISLQGMVEELRCYKIPVVFEFKPKIDARFKFVQKKVSPNMKLSWSDLPPIIIQKPKTQDVPSTKLLDTTCLKAASPVDEIHETSDFNTDNKDVICYVLNTYSKKENQTKILRKVTKTTNIQAILKAPTTSVKPRTKKTTNLSMRVKLVENELKQQTQPTVVKKSLQKIYIDTSNMVGKVRKYPRFCNNTAKSAFKQVRKHTTNQKVVHSKLLPGFGKCTTSVPQTILNGQKSVLTHSEVPANYVIDTQGLCTPTGTNLILNPIEIAQVETTCDSEIVLTSKAPCNSSDNSGHKKLMLRVKATSELT